MESSIGTRYDMDELWKHHTRWKKPGYEDKYTIPFIWIVLYKQNYRDKVDEWLLGTGRDEIGMDD